MQKAWLKRCAFSGLLIFLFSFHLRAQYHEQWNASRILHELHRLNTTTKVLYLAAHPDDENTRMISWLNHHMHIPTAYLSITRGDGGQNLIGPELREGLGVIRTHELIAARKRDAGLQFFTAANDFGFSKSVEETLRFWDENQVLYDMVWVIRHFRPDIIITRFSPEIGPRATHGHHTASAQLALKAVKMAADQTAFPDQLKHARPWQVTRVMWNTSWWFYGDQALFDSLMNAGSALKVDVGGFDPLLGESYTEIAAKARSQHRSQGFGSSGTRGESFEYLQFLEGLKPEGDLFSGISIKWEQLSGASSIARLMDRLIKSYQIHAPWLSVPQLLELRTILLALSDDALRKDKMDQLDRIILQCMGFYALAGVQSGNFTPGSMMDIDLEMVNRSPNLTFKVSNIRVNNQLQLQGTQPVSMIPGKKDIIKVNYRIPVELRPSQPYWLREPFTEGMYRTPHIALTGRDFNSPEVQVSFDVDISGQLISVQIPVYCHKTDPAKGEIIEPVHVVPDVAVQLDKPVYVFQTGKSQKVQIRLSAYADSVMGFAELNLPKGWTAQPAFYPIKLQRKGASEVLEYTVIPPANPDKAELKAMVKANGKVYSLGVQELKYEHIPYTLMFPEAKAELIHLDLKIKGQKVAYLHGAGDAVDEALRQMGYQVDVLNIDQIKATNLTSYDAVILGVRAYNTLENLPARLPELFTYIQSGGNVIVQYNTTADLPKTDLGPFPFKVSRDRVTDETASVRFLTTEHPALNIPNKLNAADFDHWVQERGLYFASDWNPAYSALLEMADPGEKASAGGLIVAPYGKGFFVYTGLSLFRQLPAGVPGAYRLLANLIAL